MIRFSRQLDRHPVSEMRVYIPPFALVFRIEGRASMRVRRTIALAVFRQLKPIFRSLECATIRHLDGCAFNMFHEYKRLVGLRQAPDLEAKAGELGFQIRMHRLKLGLTQKQLARRAGLDFTHLSELEHGRWNPRPKTLRKIEQALKSRR